MSDRKPSSVGEIDTAFIEDRENKKNNNIFQPGFKDITGFLKRNPKAGRKEVNAFMRRNRLGVSGATFSQIDLGQQSEKSLREKFSFSDKEINEVKHLIGQKGYDAYAALKNKPVKDFDKKVGTRIRKASHPSEFETTRKALLKKGEDINRLSGEKQTILNDITTQHGSGIWNTSKGKRLQQAISKDDNESARKELNSFSKFKNRNRLRKGLLNKEEKRQTDIRKITPPRLDIGEERLDFSRSPANILEEPKTFVDYAQPTDEEIFQELAQPIGGLNFTDFLENE